MDVKWAGPGVLCLGGEVDLSDGPRLRAALRRAAQASRSPVLDMVAVTFLGSEGIRAILTVVREFDPDVVLTLYPSRVVRRVLNVSGVPDDHPNLVVAGT